MLWLRFESLNGSKVSHLPEARSMRCTAAKPLFCVHILPSTAKCSGLVMLICVLALFNSGGMLHSCSLPLFLSSLAMAPWYIMPAHRFCSWSKRSDSRPVGEPFFSSGTGCSVTLPLFGSSLPMLWSPKSEYHAMPSASTTTSCGSIVGRGRSYSVMMTRVPRPLGRGKLCNGNCQPGRELRLTLLSHSACSR